MTIYLQHKKLVPSCRSNKYFGITKITKERENKAPMKPLARKPSLRKRKRRPLFSENYNKLWSVQTSYPPFFYSIFLLPTNTDITQKLMMQGKQNAQAIKLHPHSIGVSPLFAFGMLLLLAADMLNNKPEIKKSDKQNM